MIRAGRNQQGPEYSQREADRAIFFETVEKLGVPGAKPAISDGYDSGPRPTPLDPILDQAADKQAKPTTETGESTISPGHIALMGDFDQPTTS